MLNSWLLPSVELSTRRFSGASKIDITAMNWETVAWSKRVRMSSGYSPVDKRPTNAIQLASRKSGQSSAAALLTQAMTKRGKPVTSGKVWVANPAKDADVIAMAANARTREFGCRSDACHATEGRSLHFGSPKHTSSRRSQGAGPRAGSEDAARTAHAASSWPVPALARPTCTIRCRHSAERTQSSAESCPARKNTNAATDSAQDRATSPPATAVASKAPTILSAVVASTEPADADANACTKKDPHASGQAPHCQCSATTAAALNDPAQSVAQLLSMGAIHDTNAKACGISSCVTSARKRLDL
mmetsp:Transcript_141379/g.451865  ORF Transcript_141379/g.451865 Transcript_141379/m.451865 type:complete len:303 (+) Transcript_141379:468-1376(+)